MRRVILCATAALIVLTLSACGSGGGNNPPAGPSVTVSPATANVQEGSTQQFSASVTNSSNNTVTWQVNGVAGGNASVGTVSSTGLYTAPVVIPNPASVTVGAVLQANTGVVGNAIVTVTSVAFNNSSLKGNYILSVSGIDTTGNAFYAVGAVTADGNGNITGGEEDLNDVASGYVQAPSVTGTYAVGADGRGTLNLTAPAINPNITFSYAIAIRALNNAGLNEIDNNVINATGDLEQQTPGGVSAPSGGYAFGFAGTTAGCGTPLGAITSAGQFLLNSGGVGGMQDVNCGGSITQAQALNGSYTGIDGLGRGTGTFSAATGSSDFVYYVVSANRYRFLCPDAATFFLGTADLQTQSSFASTDFSGSYVVNTSANTSIGVSCALVQMNASGGSLSSGYIDLNDTGNVLSGTLTGAYTVASNGRVTGSFNALNATFPFSMYMVSPTAAYYLDLRTNAVGRGNVFAQSGSVTSNAAWAGSYATKQFGYFISSAGILPGNSTSVSGQMSADGNGNLAGTLDFNDPNGVFPGLIMQGTYSVGNVAPGRTTVTITTTEPLQPTRTYVAYVVGPGQVLLLEVDTNLTASGDAIRQF